MHSDACFCVLSGFAVDQEVSADPLGAKDQKAPIPNFQGKEETAFLSANKTIGLFFLNLFFFTFVS